ncbi:MAG: hypothetical protein K8S94_08930 [Planctomycetia bacterium]|nr:hypothetical protein [Planctomycetia bacterium]
MIVSAMPPAPLNAFDITLHARPAEAIAGDSLADAWGTWPTLAVPRAALSAPMAVGFDDALRRLGGLERLYAEPDGSFVWTSSRGVETANRGHAWWQVDGNAFEKDGRVLLVDLKGSCPAAELDRLLGVFGWPEQPLMMQLVRSATFLDEPTFRRHALARGLAGDGASLRPS